jgi:lipid II:glycine glycyltransferase (peptidoglycan interpeptide bridge formation enzyme)
MGPDLVLHRWRAATVKTAVGPGVRLGDVPPDVTEPVAEAVVADLRAAGWSRSPEGQGVLGSPRHSFHVPLAGRAPEDLFSAMNQQWRRGIRKAEKAGVVVELGGYDDLPDFHRAYLITAARDGFGAHPLEYFQRMWTALSAEGPDRIRLYLGRHDGEVLAGMVVVIAGGLAGYAYGGSVSHKREVYPSNAVHWRILQDLLAADVDVYDMRGVADMLDAEQPKFGVLRFKLGVGGDVVENIGDWDLPLQRVLYPAVMAALRLLPAGLRARAAVVTAGSRVRSRLRAALGRQVRVNAQ